MVEHYDVFMIPRTSMDRHGGVLSGDGTGLGWVANMGPPSVHYCHSQLCFFEDIHTPSRSTADARRYGRPGGDTGPNGGPDIRAGLPPRRLARQTPPGGRRSGPLGAGLTS